MDYHSFSVFHQSDIIVREITKGIFKVEKSNLQKYVEDSYIDHITLVSMLNAHKVLILNDDSDVIHINFRPAT